MSTDACLACDATRIECDELAGCCTRCDHRPDDPSSPDDVALPGLEHEQDRTWSKTQIGYLAHLARLDYGDGWRFWSVALASNDLPKKADRIYPADQVETVFLTRPGEVRRALIHIQTGEVLASGPINT